jgi:hypothetical protein
MTLVCVAPLAMALLSAAGDASLVWTASPLRWPTLHLLPAIALVALLAPLARRPPVFVRGDVPGPTSTHKHEVFA